MTSNLFTLIFLISIFIYITILLWLNIRQNKAIVQSFDKVPSEFRKEITLKDHQKANEYTQAKLKLNNFEVIFSTTILLLWTLGGGLDYLDNIWQKQTNNILYAGVGFIVSLIMLGSLINLPFSVYQTFVLEQKFGFNQTNMKTFITDLLKSTLLVLVISLPLTYAILYLMGVMGEYWWFYVWLVLIVFSILIFWLYPAYIAPIFNQFKPLDNIKLKTKINNLLERTGFKSDGIFVMDGSKRTSHANAYFTGIGKNKRIVFFDTLIKGMNDNEVQTILAHEVGHCHHQHVIKHMISSFITSLLGLVLLSYLINQNWFFHGLGISHPSNHSALVLFTLTIPIFSFFIAPINNYLSRKHEFEADIFAAKHTNVNDLVSSLVKLYRDNATILEPDYLYSYFHDSHPSASIRINQIKTFK
ncbi:MAG: M48 family metallopeptidase [Candidatus Vesicomyosocius endoextente]|uniref:M48 family metallopeptidase n=1 Tax=Candidatus Vesicomyosocius endoextente TaxID=2738853 RepID=A0A853GBK3_9GAMM|nr:M48 family metallopeptidase [Candidatus Vesicomyosocius endoextente]